jgi:SWI/SNF-related matrix-associated actin-dependent regulator of chromatin subfamily A3
MRMPQLAILVPPSLVRTTFLAYSQWVIDIHAAVAPLSVISNWSTQIEEHLTEDAGINHHVYYGNGRNVTAKFLKSQDIVITTYHTLSADLPSTKTVVAADGTSSVQVSSTKTGLFAVKWKRIVLDEGHTIRNPKSAFQCIQFRVQA